MVMPKPTARGETSSFQPLRASMNSAGGIMVSDRTQYTACREAALRRDTGQRAPDSPQENGDERVVDPVAVHVRVACNNMKRSKRTARRGGLRIHHAEIGFIEQVAHAIATVAEPAQLHLAVEPVGVEGVVHGAVLRDGMRLGVVEADVIQAAQVLALGQHVGLVQMDPLAPESSLAA